MYPQKSMQESLFIPNRLFYIFVHYFAGKTWICHCIFGEYMLQQK